MPIPRWTAAVVAALTLAALAGCGSSSGGSAQTGSGSTGTASATASGPTEIKIAAFKGADSAPAYIGVEKGIFERHGFDVEITPVNTGADGVALLQSGQAQFGVTQPAVIIQAIGKGVPLKLVSGLDVYSGDADYVQFLTKDPAIRSWKDLAGKRVAIIVFKNVVDLGLQRQLRESGVDPASVKVVPMIPPQQLSALKSGAVDVIAPAEPTQTAALADPDVHSLGTVWTAITEGDPDVTVPGAAVMATSSYLDANGDTATRFTEAMNEAVEYAQAHPDETRAAIAKYAELPLPLVKDMTLPTFTPDLPVADVMRQARIEQELGWIDQAPTEQDIFWQGAGT